MCRARYCLLGRVPISFIFECQQTNERARMDGEETFHFTPRSFLVRVLPKNGMKKKTASLLDISVHFQTFGEHNSFSWYHDNLTEAKALWLTVCRARYWAVYLFHSSSNASKQMSVQEWMEKTFHFTPRSFLVRVLPKNGMSGMPLGKMGLYLLELYGTEYTRPYCYCTRWGETFFFHCGFVVASSGFSNLICFERVFIL